MPARKLYASLLEKCEGRVVRSDLGWADDAENAANPDVEEELKGIADQKTWKRYREAQKAVDGKSVRIFKTHVDYLLE
jgi:hypothetical protein